MNLYYKELCIDKYIGHEVLVLLRGGIKSYVGELYHDIVNEDYEEDGEEAALALKIDGQEDLQEVEYKDILLIAKASEANLIQVAV